MPETFSQNANEPLSRRVRMTRTSRAIAVSISRGCTVLNFFLKLEGLCTDDLFSRPVRLCDAIRQYQCTDTPQIFASKLVCLLSLKL